MAEFISREKFPQILQRRKKTEINRASLSVAGLCRDQNGFLCTNMLKNQFVCFFSGLDLRVSAALTR